MKRMLCLLLATSMALMLFGCSSETDKSKSVDAATVSVGSTGMRVQEINGIEYKIPITWESYTKGDNYYYYPEGQSASQEAMLMVNYASMDGSMDYSNVSDTMDAYADGVGEADGASNLMRGTYPEWGDDAIKLTYTLDVDSVSYNVTHYATPVLMDGIFSIAFFGGKKYQPFYDFILENVKFPSQSDAALDDDNSLDDSDDDDDDYYDDYSYDSSNESDGFSASSASSDNNSLSTERASALQKAHDYLNYTAFSRTGLIEQLEFEGFSNEDATYAVDECGADWKAQATLKAKEYRKLTAFSHKGLVEQLEFEGFTHEQAEYGVSQGK